ncbi:MAG: phosphoribosylanthranilate isomerase [Clostridiales bacterium]|nr:phosphoribosylanthranilate isomerase [Clostridiales bacterium]
MNMKIKICGLTREVDIEYVNEYNPDYIGFIFYKLSRRLITKEKAKVLKTSLSRSIKAVGVFVNEDINVIRDIWEADIIDLIQLHGDETEEYIIRLKEITKAPIIKAIRVRDKEQIKISSKTCADFLLFDSYNKNMYGGTGEKFNWEIIDEINKSFFLAGGIGLEDIKQAKALGAYAIDVSSSVETDGVKDRDKIKDIINGVRKY